MTPFATLTDPPAIPVWHGPGRIVRLLVDDEPPKLGRPPKVKTAAPVKPQPKEGVGKRVYRRKAWKAWTVITPANEARLRAAVNCWPLIGGTS